MPSRSLLGSLRARLRRLLGASGASRPFVLLSEEHIGVVRLGSLLDAHPRVRLRRLGPQEGATDAVGQLRDALTPAPDADAVGLSARFEHLRDPDIVAVALRELGPLVLHVFHGNLVRAALWRLGARRAPGWFGEWRRAELGEVDAPSPPPIPPPEPFDPQVFTGELRTVEIGQVELRRFVDGLGLPVVRITDDRLLDAEEGVVADVLGRLGVDPPSVEHPPVRRSHERLLDLYEDVEPLRRHLEGTPYLPMLEELTGASADGR